MWDELGYSTFTRWPLTADHRHQIGESVSAGGRANHPGVDATPAGVVAPTHTHADEREAVPVLGRMPPMPWKPQFPPISPHPAHTFDFSVAELLAPDDGPLGHLLVFAEPYARQTGHLWWKILSDPYLTLEACRAPCCGADLASERPRGDGSKVVDDLKKPAEVFERGQSAGCASGVDAVIELDADESGADDVS